MVAGRVEARLANLQPCLIGMKVCVGSHHLSRRLKALGHDARLMSAKCVRPYSKGQRTTSVTQRRSWNTRLSVNLRTSLKSPRKVVLRHAPSGWNAGQSFLSVIPPPQRRDRLTRPRASWGDSYWRLSNRCSQGAVGSKTRRAARVTNAPRSTFFQLSGEQRKIGFSRYRSLRKGEWHRHPPFSDWQEWVPYCHAFLSM